MISRPYEHEHPLFQGQREYVLERAILDTGDDANEATATLAFRHRHTSQRRVFRFSGIGLTSGIGAISQLRGYLPVYVASLEGRGWDRGGEIEVGDTDPGGVWFWAETLQEIQ